MGGLGVIVPAIIISLVAVLSYCVGFYLGRSQARAKLNRLYAESIENKDKRYGGRIV